MQSRASWDDTACSAIAVSVVRRANKPRLLTFGKLRNAFVPASDNLANTDCEFKRFASMNTGVEYSAVWEGASVVHFNSGSLWADRTFSSVVLDNLERHNLS